MDSNQTSARFPWVATALSFLSSGVGHIYCGRITKGLFLYSARLLLPLLCIVAAFVQPSNAVLFALILVPAVATIIVFLYSPIDAAAIAKQSGAEYELKEYNRTSLYWLLVVMQLACFVGMIFATREYVYQAFFIPERSMSPSFLSGDRILVNKRPFRSGFPERGDVIVFRPPPSEPANAWIKRVIGVAGDQIVIKGRDIEVNGKQIVHERVPTESIANIRKQIDGEVYDESHAGRRYRVLVAEDSDGSDMEEIKVTVPERSVFVLGDNRNRSRDSRHFGSIHVSDVIGYVDYNYFPAETWSLFGVQRD